jgi:hypothetical protein
MSENNPPLDNAQGNGKLDLRLTVKVVDLTNVEKELKVALLQVSTTPSSRVSTQAFDIGKCEFAGAVQDFQAMHMPLVSQGQELAFVTGRTSSLPFPPEMGLEEILCKTTLVADLTMIRDDLYQDIADQIDRATQQKVDQLKPLWNHNREIYVFVDIGEIATSRQMDMDRVLPRLRANIFDRYPGLLGGVVLAMRVWDCDLRH